MTADTEIDTIIAGVDLAGRAGATNIEFGYLDDTKRSQDARWWAKATFQGAVLMVEDQPSPDTAVEALAVRICSGAVCTHCGCEVSIDGFPFSDDGFCRWRRVGRQWIRGCESKEAP